MIAPLLIIVALGGTYLAGRRSLGRGLVVLLTVGYFYGILRANLLTVYSHFIFDAALMGLYLSQKWTSSDPKEARRLETLRLFVVLLVAWPCLLVLMPFQPLLVSLVGLRGNVFFIPVLLLGARLKNKDLMELATGLAVLNVIAIVFATMEYVTSVTRFYPPSPVTEIIYISGDVAGGFFRIPAIFSSAHAYGGSMVFSLPFLTVGWERSQSRPFRLLAMVGIGAAMVGVLMSATRQNFILGSAIVLTTILTNRMRNKSRIAFLLMIGLVAWAALTNARFQRFKTLSDTDMMVERISGSVNRGFFEILLEYPMGNGLGGGGTSIPYFLHGQVRNPIGMENEYTRILCEQGIIGLALWLIFVAWFLSRRRYAFARSAFASSRRTAWCLAVFMLGTAWIGIGTFTSIPQTVIMLLGIGWTALPPSYELKDASPMQRFALAVPTSA